MSMLSRLTAPLPTPEEMAKWDAAAETTYGIPSLLLMENAAAAAKTVLLRLARVRKDHRIIVVMGKGNNGGDGAALARMLHDEGFSVLVCSAGPVENMRRPAKEHAAMAVRMGVPFIFAEASGNVPLPEAWRSPNIVVDALTGTGIRGDLRPKELALVRFINKLRGTAFVLSLDIPSGLCGCAGRPVPEAVVAHATVCFEAGKPGLYMPGARAYTGDVHLLRVGVPLAVREEIPATWALLRPQPGCVPVPSAFRHKGQAGRVLVIGGSEGMSGAPLLAALGSLRTGAGLTHVALPGALATPAAAVWPELMLHPIGRGGSWQADDAASLRELMKRTAPHAVVIGPGMGRANAVGTILKGMLEEKNRPPFIIDADALYQLTFADVTAQKGCHDRIPAASVVSARDILTPHPGEMARLLPQSFFASADASSALADIVQENRSAALGSGVRACDAVLVLKGPGTLIGRKDKPTVLSPHAVAALSVGGSGDVLSGICAALVASRLPSFEAACLGVYLHARAGELLTERARVGHSPQEIANTLPQVWSELWSE